jgi:hypothetical protein
MRRARRELAPADRQVAWTVHVEPELGVVGDEDPGAEAVARVQGPLEAWQRHAADEISDEQFVGSSIARGARRRTPTSSPVCQRKEKAMKLALTMVLVSALLALSSPLTAAQPANYLEADGCDVMAYVEPLPSGSHTGSWLVESLFSGERYTFTYDQVSVLVAIDPSGLSGREVLYVNWRLEELGARGTNRTENRWNVTESLWPFNFDGEIIRATRYPEGGIGGT